MCGWDRRAAACASARIQSRDASSTASPARTLTATGRPSTSSYARHTTDIPPPPRRSTSRYRSPSRSTRAVFAIAALGGLALLTGCGAANGAHWQAAGTVPGQKAPAAPAVTAPADGATNVATATELSLTGTDAKSTVTLAAADGTAVPGALRADGSTWVPGTQLQWNTAYTATVATPGRPAAKKVTFTTMNTPDNLVR